jgi:Flp pilus assembly secretin CpaC
MPLAPQEAKGGYMNRLLVLFLLAVPALAGTTGPEDIPVAMGISRTFDFGGKIGTVILGDPKVLTYFRVRSGPATEQLLVIPKATGKTNLIVLGADARPSREFLFTVSDRGVASQMETQMNEERAAGKPVEKLSLPLGQSRAMPIQRLGSIMLTDPGVLGYVRIKGSGESITLVVTPKKAGFTDLTTYDTEGNVHRRYFVEVTR